MYTRQTIDYFSDPTEYNEAFKVHVVPMALYLNFARRHSLQDLHCYGKVREMASLKDIIELEILRLRFLSAKPREGMNVLSGNVVAVDSLFDEVGTTYSLTDEQAAELSHVRNFELQNPRHYFEVLSRYWTLPEVDDDVVIREEVGPSEKPYQILKGPSRLYILMGEGSLAQIESGEARQCFLSEVLKAFYAIAPLEQVNQSSWYRLYLEGLAKAC